MFIRRLLRFFCLGSIPLLFALGFAVVGQETEDPLLIRARELRLNEVYLESARLYRAHIAEKPEDSAARMEFAELLLQLDEPAEAANQMIPVLAEDPGDPRAREMFDESLRRVEESVDPADAGPLLLQIARLHRFSGDTETARTFYDRYLDANPGNPLALHELAQMTFDEGETKEGLAKLEEAIAAAEEDGARRELVLKRAVWISFDPDRQEEAVAAFESLLDEYPGLAEGHIRLGDLYRFRGDYEEAGEAYAEAVRIGGPDERATEGYYQVLLRTRALESAREARMEGSLDEALRYYDLHFAEMEKTRQRLADLDRREADGRITPGQRRAAEFFRRFIDETPEEADVRVEMAEVFSESGDQAAAIAQMKKAVELRPSDRALQLRLARYQTFEEGSVAEAAATLDAMTETFGPDPEVASLRGDVFRFQGDYAEASRAYRRVLEENPDDPQALAGMAEVEAIFTPEFFGGIGFTRDWSSDYDHLNMDLGIRNIFSGIEHRIDAQYRFLYYSQPIATQNPALGDRRRSDVVGNEINVSIGGPLKRPWSYLASLGGVFYDHVDGTVLGRIGLGYAGERLSAVFGFRRREAVFEHYNLSALLDEVRSNDFFGQAIYQTVGDNALERWQFEGFGETGWFSDGNYRSRVIGTILNRLIEDEENSLKLGFRGLYLDYSEESANYFSPSDYYGLGVTGRYDHRFNESTNAGAAGTVLWIEQVSEFDIAVGGYLDHQISDASRASLRLDYGQSTFTQGDIRSFSGRAEIQILF